MDEQLKQLHAVEIEILDLIHQICVENNLHYSLYAGTLLGAVRHKGFIPWDDDLDICMPRKDYEQFLEICPKYLGDNYVLQNKKNTPTFTQSFTKIRKKHTCFLETEFERGLYFTGIFVDIFPVDRMPNGMLNRALFAWKCMQYQLFHREYIPPEGNKIVKMVSQVILNVNSSERRKRKREKIEADIASRADMNQLNTVFIEIFSTSILPMPSDLIDEFVYLDFEGKKYMCFKKWDEYLKLQYGNYMQLPPEEERVLTHHPVILDFDHSYEELEGIS